MQAKRSSMVKKRTRKNIWLGVSYLLISSFLLISCEKNYPPHINDVSFTRTPGNYTTSFVLTVEASDPNLDPLTYLWEAPEGAFDNPDKMETTWTAPGSPSDKEYQVSISVSDGKETVTSTVQISVMAPRYGKLTGFAYFAGCKVPVAYALVNIANRQDSTDFYGAFELDGVMGGRQTLAASKEGFADASLDIKISEGINQTVIYMSSEEFTSSIEGQCVGNISGESKPWLEVIILNPDLSESGLRSLSDGSGYYKITNVPRGPRMLIVKDETGNIKLETQLFIEETDMVFNVPVREPFKFTDPRDNHQYTAVKIKGQTWMAENLAYIPHVSPQWEQGGIWVYGYSGSDLQVAKASDNYKKYGCLYDWKTAVSDDYGNGKDICPPGWHLPTDQEWIFLELALGMDPIEQDSVGWRYSGTVGKKLKFDAGWENDGNGNNSSSFGVLPAGNRSTVGTFLGLLGYANFWTASELNTSSAWRRYLYWDREAIGRYTDLKNNGHSVRCVKD